jgi:hypothetical protein
MVDSRRTERLVKELVKYLPEEYIFEINKTTTMFSNASMETLNKIGITIMDNEIRYCDYTYNVYNCSYGERFGNCVKNESRLSDVVEKFGPQRILHELWSSIQYKIDKYNRGIKQLEELIYGDD